MSDFSSIPSSSSSAPPSVSSSFSSSVSSSSAPFVSSHPTSSSSKRRFELSSSFSTFYNSSESEKIPRSAPHETHEIHQDQEQEEESDGFFDLLSHFAGLTFPSSDPNRLEPCPTCPNQYPISSFAEHVYDCIKSLDDEEKRALEVISEKYARKLAETGEFAVEYDEGSAFRRPSGICSSGINCKRTDSNHFRHVYHPSVPCPICSLLFPLYEINAHITFCLEQPRAFQAELSSIPETSNSLISQQKKIIKKSKLPIRADDSEEEQETEENPIDESQCQLTVEQASLVASMLLKKNRGGSKLDEKDPSLVEMLDTFKTLGFTAANLAKLKEQTLNEGPKRKEETQNNENEEKSLMHEIENDAIPSSLAVDQPVESQLPDL
jgi:hypothetical protein